MKKALKALFVLLAIIGAFVLIFAALAVANEINEAKINDYIDTFAAVEKENTLIPSQDTDGSYYFVTDENFKVLHLTDIHIGGGFMSAKTDKQVINAIAAMVSAEKPDLVVATGDISFPVPYVAATVNNAYAHGMFKRLMERLGVYWTVTFGNHDSEAYNYHDRAAVSAMYTSEELEYCLFSSTEGLSGEGNHRIDVKNTAGFITESFYMIDTHAYTDKDPLGLKWDYDFVKEDQIEWYRESVTAANAKNKALYDTLPDSEKEAFADLLAPKSLMFMHIPLREVKYAYDEYVNNNRQNTDNVSYIEGYDGETDEVVYCSRTDEQLFEAVLELGSTQALFYGHDHLNNFVLEYKGVTLSYGYSLDYLAYSGIADEGYQRGCTVITCAPDGNATVVHENYYQDKYPSLYEKESVNMEKNVK